MDAIDQRIEDKHAVAFYMNISEVKLMYSTCRKLMRIVDPTIQAQPNFNEEELRVAKNFMSVSEKGNLI